MKFEPIRTASGPLRRVRGSAVRRWREVLAPTRSPRRRRHDRQRENSVATVSVPHRFLRAQQLYSDCVYERQEQIREKEVMKLWEKEKEKAYHEDVMRHVAEGDRREAAELEARKLKNAVICKQQQAQLAEFRENYLERLRIEKRDGELIQKKVARISVSLHVANAHRDSRVDAHRRGWYTRGGGPARASGPSA